MDLELSRISDVEAQSEAHMQSTKQELGLPKILQRQAEKLRLVAGQLIGLLSNAPAAGWTDDNRRRLKSLLLLAVNRIVYRGEDDFDIYLQLPPPPSSQQAKID